MDMEKKFIEMIHRHERIIYKVCSFYISDQYPMSDLYQDVIINLWKAFAGFRNECALSTWVYRITLNTCISGLRKEKRQMRHHVPLSVLNDLPDELDDGELEEKIQTMYLLINQLKTMEKAIVLLYLEDKSYQQIADITGLTLSNVATKLKRAKEKLKKMSNSLKNNEYGIG